MYRVCSARVCSARCTRTTTTARMAARQRSHLSFRRSRVPVPGSVRGRGGPARNRRMRLVTGPAAHPPCAPLWSDAGEHGATRKAYHSHARAPYGQRGGRRSRRVRTKGLPSTASAQTSQPRKNTCRALACAQDPQCVRQCPLVRRRRAGFGGPTSVPGMPRRTFQERHRVQQQRRPKAFRSELGSQRPYKQSGGSGILLGLVVRSSPSRGRHVRREIRR